MPAALRRTGGVPRRKENPMSIIPFDDRDGFIWYDGRLLPWRDARLHVLGHFQLPPISLPS